jgi:hypothetical protein
MAGAGKKTFTAGEVLTASDVNTYLMEQSVMVFGGTAARSSAIPTPSTGMTTYIGVSGTATIPQIETYTGAAWQTLYGLTQVANVTVSSAAAVIMDNIFTSAYQNYRVMIRYTGVTPQINLEPRSSGSTISGNFFTAILGWTYNAGTTNINQTDGSFLKLNVGYDTSRGAQTLDILDPTSAAPTCYQVNGVAETMHVGSSLQLNSSAVQGLRFSANSGTFSATIRVYGYRNS